MSSEVTVECPETTLGEQAALLIQRLETVSAAEYVNAMNAMGMDPKGAGKRARVFLQMSHATLSQVLEAARKGDLEVAHGTLSDIHTLHDELIGTLFTDELGLVVALDNLRIQPHKGMRRVRRLNPTLE